MERQELKPIVDLARKTGWVLIATGDKEGLPHIAAASRLRIDAEGNVTVGGWFCPSTVANLQQNRQISLVVWKSSTDTGYQMLGEVQKVEELAVLDGLAPQASSVPQVERRLVVRVDKLLAFSHAPHLDVPP